MQSFSKSNFEKLHPENILEIFSGTQMGLIDKRLKSLPRQENIHTINHQGIKERTKQSIFLDISSLYSMLCAHQNWRKNKGGKTWSCVKRTK